MIWRSPNPVTDAPCELYAREGTVDGDTLQSALIEDEYEARSLIAPGDVVVDCGAYIGGFSVLALSRGAVVHAIEPIQSNCDLARANTQTWADRFHLTRAALSSAPGPIEIRAASGLHRFMGVVGDGGEFIESVPTVTLNEILDPLFIVRILKSDMEGGEWDSFRDLSSENLAKIERVHMEVHPPNGVTLEQSFKEMHALLPGFRLLKTSASDAWFAR